MAHVNSFQESTNIRREKTN